MVEARTKEWSAEKLSFIARQARQELDVRDRTYHFVNYPMCFVARDMATWFVEKGHARDRAEAVLLGRALVEHLHIVHVVRDHNFKDEYLFFKFMSDTRDGGHVYVPENGVPPKSWRVLLDSHPELAFKDINPHKLKEMLRGVSSMAEQDGELPHVMLDEINCQMYDNIRPLEWVDPVVPEQAAN